MGSGDRGGGSDRQGVARRRVLQAGVAVGFAALTGCTPDAGRAQLLAARPLLRHHARLLADVYALRSTSGLARTLEDTPRAVRDLAAGARDQLRPDERLDTLASVAPAPDLSAPRPDGAVAATGPPPVPTVEALVDADELLADGLADAGLRRSLVIVRTRRDDLDAIALLQTGATTIQTPLVVSHGLAELAAHRIARDTETIADAQLPWWVPRLREKYRQSNAVAAWRLTRGDTELTRAGRYRVDVAGTWTIEGNAQASGERHVEIDWQPSRAQGRRSTMTIRQGRLDADGLATWNERLTTVVDFDHDRLWGP